VQVYPSANVAAGRPATQISTSHDAPASRAVDGNTSGSWGDNSVTHTPTHANPWWKVDLGEVLPIGKVVVYNRTDCCAERLDGFILEVLGEDGTVTFTYTEGVMVESRREIEVHSFGRWVKIRLPGAGRILSLAEVEVYTAAIE
jgi:F5/8 type C domain